MATLAYLLWPYPPRGAPCAPPSCFGSVRAARRRDWPKTSGSRCAACEFTFFFNPTVAAAAYVFDPSGRALFIRRAHDPAAGKLGIPGGFIDVGETAEDGLRREVREEVGLEVERLRFFLSCPNLYHYRDVTYPVVDLIFLADALNPERAAPLDAVAGLEWRAPAETDPSELAFESLRVSLLALRSGHRI
jgi:ADP-ribose pyrophosphatase YjhB (NUDIX family)